MRLATLILSICAPGALLAADCMSLISASRLQTVVLRDRKSIEADASTFCSEHSRSTRTSRSFNYKVAYESLRGAIGSGKASEAQVASNFCSSTQRDRFSTDAYESYIQSIAPGAYQAYAACMRFPQEMTFDLQAKTATELVMTVSFRPTTRTGTTARVSHLGSTGSSCEWQGKLLPGSEYSFGGAGTATLICRRQPTVQPRFVVVSRNDGVSTSMSIPWHVGPDGSDVPSLLDLRKDVRDLRTTLAEISEPIIVAYSGEKSQANTTTQIFDFAKRIADDDSLVQTGASWAFTAPKLGLYAVSVVFSLPYGPNGTGNISPFVTCSIEKRRTPESKSALVVGRHLFDTGCSLSTVVLLEQGSAVWASLGLAGAVAAQSFGHISIARVGGAEP